MEKEEKKLAVCRVCLNCGPEDKCLSIFEEIDECPISDKINALASVGIKEGDGLPDRICGACLLDLEAAYNFKLKCESTNQELLSVPNSPIKHEYELVKEEFLSDDDGSSPEAHGVEYLDENITLKPLVVPKPSKAIDLKLICDDCGDSFPSKCKIRVHWKKVHMRDKLKCPRCLRQFGTYTSFKTHQNKKPKNCIEAAQFHIEGVGKDRIYQCKQCNYRSHRIQASLAHMVVHTGERKFECKICQKKFLQYSGLQAHTERAHPVDSMKMMCPFCGKQYIGRTKYNSHIRLVHKSNTKYPCKLCSVILKTKRSFKEHLKRHSGVKQYVCDICAKSFTTQSSLINHKRMVHAKFRKQFTCDTCQYTAYKAEIIKIHSTKHSPTNKACNICGKFLENELQLLLHKKRHTEKNYLCTECDKKFYSRKNMYAHVRSMHRTIIGIN